ncbi:glutamate-binding protein of ABC transporter system [Actinomycetales bacterium JB111]|nr:glutamate-binding protein of ABC transporter system [Actinomycetales bacterium JB111]
MARTRRNFATLLGAGLLATTLAACGGGDDNEDDTQAPPSQSEDSEDSGDQTEETGSDDAQGGAETGSDEAGSEDTGSDDASSDDADGEDGAAAGGGELSEADACAEYQNILLEFGESTNTDPSDLEGMTEGLTEYGTSMADLAERSPENLAPLFQSEADYIESLSTGAVDPDAMTENADNTMAIAEACTGA